MENVLKLGCKTSFPSYQVVFEWEFENYSKVPEGWTKKSQDFSVEPDSSWNVRYRKHNSEIYLYLCRNKGKNIKVNCETSILNCKKEVLYKTNCIYENSVEVDLLPSSCRHILSILPEDKVTFKIFIIQTDTEPSTVYMTPLPNTTEVSMNHLKNWSKDLKKFLDNKVKTDVTISIGGESLSAHKNILMARSEVFAKMFQKGMAEEEDSVVNIEDIDVNTMKIVLSFMYSAQLDECDSETALEVYRAADKYDIADLREAFVHVLTSKMTLENVCKVLSFADMCHNPELKEKAMQFIALHYKPKQTELLEKS